MLIANVTEMLDRTGGWKALDTAGMRDLVHAATMAGRVAAAAKAVELGYAIEADQGPSGRLDHWGIAGIPAEVAELFSKRSAAIDDELAQKGFRSYRARGIAARNTRDPKQGESPEALIVRWLNELDGIGWPTRKLVQRLQHIQHRQYQPLRTFTDTERAELVRSMIGPGGPLAQRKAFTRDRIIRDVAPHLYGCVPEELDRVVTAIIQHPEAIPLVGQPGARGRAWAAATALATEAAIEDVAQRLTEREGRTVVPAAAIEAAIAAKESALGAALTAGQRRAAAQIATSGRGLDLVVGVAGSGKTAALDVARSAFETAGYRVLGTAISGQAARPLGEAAGVESRTIASLVWRLEHGSLRLDDRTVLLVDEAGMADDPAMLRLLAAVDVAGAKAVLIGDHRQLGAVGPGGGLEALVSRHGPAVHVLDENIRQRDPAERQALEELRAGSVAAAVDWYRANNRLVTTPTRDEALDAAVEPWLTDIRAGQEAVLLAWRRSDVAALNERARELFIGTGLVSGPEFEAPGGKRYAAGDRVVTLAPGERGRFVTSQRGTVTAVNRGELMVQFDDGRSQTLAGEELGADLLDHAYAVTVHRMQGATVDRAHVFADGGGRELAYVAMSRASETSRIYVVADDLEQAAEDLTAEWSADRRQRWVLDVDEPALDGRARRPSLAQRTDSSLRLARLRAERDAVQAVAPDADARLRSLDLQLQLEQVAQRPVPAREVGWSRGL